MRLKKLLEQNKKAIVNQWFERVVKTYAPDTAQFIKNQKDPFSNPVGNALSQGLAVLFDQLLAGPILILKNVIRDILENELKDSRIANELLQFELHIDALSLAAFDIYVACKEKIYDLKTNLEKNKVYRAFERAGLITETPEGDPGLQ
jgi:hypothetical protein